MRLRNQREKDRSNMRDINRIDPIIEELEKAWKKPGWNDMRFGQFMSNILGDIAKANDVSDIWFPEDDKWLKWLQEFNAKNN